LSRRIVQTVVFGDGAGGGNPCPVVFDADGLSTEDMQALAAELGHETAFVLEPRAGGDVRLRYFVPRHEMEMCVHATVASVVLLAREGRAANVVETPLGARRATVDVESGRAMIEQSTPVFGPPLEDPSRVLEVLGAEPVAGPVLAASTARAKLLVPLASEAALDGLHPDHPALWSLCDELGVTGFYPYTRDASGADAAARQFPRDAGYDEDPATGVAACALGAYLTSQAGSDGWSTWTIAQGRAMGRPSLITAESLRIGDGVTATRVGGTMRVV
jgi:trans-2,3-dihydro-3-hydroxyanthranilate isomerase